MPQLHRLHLALGALHSPSLRLQLVLDKVNSAFHPSGVGKLSTGLSGWLEFGGVRSLVSVYK